MAERLPMAELERAIRLPHATAMVVGTIIGASIFVQPSEITARVPWVTGVILVWIAAGVLTLFGALVCAELASTFARTGGVYVYLREAYSPAAGFLWGWAMFWTMHTGIIAAIAIVCARYVGFVAYGDAGDQRLGEAGTRTIAIAVIVLLSAVNYVGVRHGSTLQALFTLGKLLAVAALVVLGFAFGSPAAPEATESAAPIGVESFLLAISAGLFAFGGWHMVTYNSDETVDPRRTIPRALVIGTLVVTACYVALNAVYLYVLPIGTVAKSTRIAADAAGTVLGADGGRAISALVVFSTFGAISGIVLAGPRVYYAMARDGLLFRWFGEVHPRFRTPHRAIALQGVWASVLVATDSYRALFSRVVYTEWIFFGAMAVGLILLRRRKDLERGYSVWGYPAVPLSFALAAFLIVVNHVVSKPSESATGLGYVLIGLPVYHLWTRLKRAGAETPPPP